MSETIEIRVDERGRLRVEFIGFAGELCLEEAERLQKVLSGLGLKVTVSDLEMKTAAQIEQELGIEGRPSREIRTRGDDR